MNRFSYTFLLLAGAAATPALMLGATSAQAQQAQDIDFDLPSQPLPDALNDFARQAGVQILFPYDAAVQKRSPVVRGRMSRAEAVRRLVAGSGLEIASMTGQTVTLRIVPDGPGSAAIIRAEDEVQPTDTDERPADIVVTGARAAREDALDRKRRATNFREVATSDDVGKLPDRNLADALSRLTGVSVTDSNGEGRFVSIRGIPPELNLVTVNGQPAAVSDVDGRAGRSGPLDVIGAGDFATIEVYKTLRPDLDAQGLGGAINVNMPSAYSRDTAFGYARAEAGHSDQTTGAKIYAGSAGYARQFANDKLGVYTGASYSRDQTRNQSLSAQNWGPAGTIHLPDRVDLDDLTADVERFSVSTNVEFRPDDSLHTYLRGAYNRYHDDEVRPETEIRLRGTPVFLTPTSGTSSSASVDMETRHQIINRDILTLSTGLRKDFGGDDRFRVETQFTYSRAREHKPLIRYYEFNLTNRVPATFDASGQFPLFDLGTPRQTPSNYSLDQYRQETSLEKEQLYVPSIDLTAKTNLFGADTEIKIGAKATIRDRFVDDTSNRWKGAGATLTLDGLAQFGPTDYRGGYSFGPEADMAAVDAFFKANPSRFAFNAVDSTTNSAEDDYTIAERIYAGYAMMTVNAGPVNIVGGARVEYTDVRIQGNQATFAGKTFLGLESRVGKSRFTDIFPSLQARWNITKRLLVRAAVTTSIGRPDFVDLAPISNLTFNETATGSNIFAGSLSEGNPALKPYRATNLDAAVEFYPNRGSLISVAAFYKDIGNPIFQRRERQMNTVFDGRTFEELDITRTENAKSGYIEGVEFTWQQQFDFLPGLLRGLGFSVNATFTKSKLVSFDRTDDLPFIGQPKRLYNAQVFYELGRVEARVGYQRTSDRLVLLVLPGADYYRATSDNLSARLAVETLHNLFLYGEAENLTNNQAITYQGIPVQIVGDQIFGRTFRFGLSTRF